VSAVRLAFQPSLELPNGHLYEVVEVVEEDVVGRREDGPEEQCSLDDAAFGWSIEESENQAVGSDEEDWEKEEPSSGVRREGEGDQAEELNEDVQVEGDWCPRVVQH